MTENIERFRVMNHDDYELDYIADRHHNFKKLDLYDCCELLNKFSEGNQRLQKENKILYDENIQLRNKLLHFIQLKDDIKYLEEKGVF